MSPLHLTSALAGALELAARRAATQFGLPATDARAYLLTLLYEHFHLLAVNAARHAAREHALKYAVGVGPNPQGEASIAYALVDEPRGQQAVVVFADEIITLIEAMDDDTREALHAAHQLVTQSRAPQAGEVLRALVERKLDAHVRGQFEHAATALLLTRQMDAQDALRTAAQLAGPTTSTSA